MSTDGARSVCCKCQGDVPQETIKGMIVFQIYGNDHEPGTAWKGLTLLEVWTTGGQWASLWSGTSPVWAADKAPSWIRSLEECLSAGSKCSSWPSGPGDPLKTDTEGKPMEVISNTPTHTHRVRNQTNSHKRIKLVPEELLIKHLLTAFRNTCLPL